jgi:uncharacterized protein (TIGR03437 family)
MSILRRTQQLSACAALAAFAAFAQAPTNLYLLPNSSATSPTVASYRTDPFTSFSQFPVQPGASFLLLHPNGQKLYSVARSGAETLRVMDAINPGAALKSENLGQAEAAVLSPDGRRLLIAAGSLAIFDTNTDTKLAQLSDVGNTPVDIAVSLDSTRAFVLSQVSNRLTAVDLNTNTVAGAPLTISGNPTGVAVAPNGLVYVTATNIVQVIDGRTMTIVKEFPLSATPGKLVFTPDGLYGVAVNRTPVTGSTVIVVDLARGAIQTIGRFNNEVLDRLVVVGNNRIYALSNLTALMYEISMSPLNINPPQYSGIESLTGITDVVASNEVPNPRFLFVLRAGTITQLDLSAYPPLRTGSAISPTQPGPLVHLNAQTTGTPTVVLAYNTAQSTTPGGTYLPLIARVTNSVGKPLVGVNVTFTSDNSGATIQGATVTTNTQGWAQTTVIAPSTAGTFNVTAFAGPGPGQPTATYVLSTATGSTGGTASSLLSIVSGQGQLGAENYFFSKPLTVQLLDTAGKPVAGQLITFTLATGSADLSQFTQDGLTLGTTICTSNVCTATTDVLGQAQVGVRASPSIGNSYSQQTIAATNGSSTVIFYATTYGIGNNTGANPVIPQMQRIKPVDAFTTITGQIGTTLNEAIQFSVVTVQGNPLPNVALDVRTTNLDPAVGPVANCVGDGSVALTNANGVATCNLKIGGRTGTADLAITIGGAQNNPGGGRITLDVRPGPPAILRIVRGNNQSGPPGQRLQVAFVIEVQDASGNILPGQTANWEIVTPNSITLTNVVSVADPFGQVSALGTLGNVAGANQVRVRVGTIVQTFTFTTNLTISQMSKVTGDGQSALINRPFPGTLVVEVRDERNSPVPGQAVLWSVVGGSANLSGSTVATDSNGRSTITATAGSLAGTVTIRATLGSLTQTFTLTVTPPGPVFTAAGIVTTARNQPGISPCGLATIFGSNIAVGVSGVVNTNFLGIGGLPLSYNGLEVEIGGFQSPILAVANQAGTESLVIQVPCEIPSPGRVSVIIRIPGSQLQVDGVQVFRAAPGLFETTATSVQRAYAAVLRPDGSYVSPTNPARRGEIVQAAVTGLGPTNPGSITNRVGLGGQSVVAPLVVGLNNQGVRVVSATYAPGLIGVYWVAFEIPADLTPGLYINLAVAAESPTGELVFGNGSNVAAIQ